MTGVQTCALPISSFDKTTQTAKWTPWHNQEGVFKFEFTSPNQPKRVVHVVVHPTETASWYQLMQNEIGSEVLVDQWASPLPPDILVSTGVYGGWNMEKMSLDFQFRVVELFLWGKNNRSACTSDTGGLFILRSLDWKVVWNQTRFIRGNISPKTKQFRFCHHVNCNAPLQNRCWLSGMIDLYPSLPTASTIHFWGLSIRSPILACGW